MQLSWFCGRRFRCSKPSSIRFIITILALFFMWLITAIPWRKRTTVYISKKIRAWLANITRMSSILLTSCVIWRLKQQTRSTISTWTRISFRHVGQRTVLSCEANLYTALHQIDFSPFSNRKIAFMIPIFQYTVEERAKCSTDSCFEGMVSRIPRTTAALLACIRGGQCQIANAYLTTHVGAMERYHCSESWIRSGGNMGSVSRHSLACRSVWWSPMWWCVVILKRLCTMLLLSTMATTRSSLLRSFKHPAISFTRWREYLALMHLIWSKRSSRWFICRSNTAKSYNGNQEGRQRMKKFIKAFLNRLGKMPKVETQPVCDKTMAQKVFPTLFLGVCW